MKEFVFGTDGQFEWLDHVLQDNLCHVFNRCVLPLCCSPDTARIGFEKNSSGHYIIYTDKGISAETEHADFIRFLEKGEIRFLCREDMISFLQSLRPLFPSNDHPDDRNTPQDPVETDSHTPREAPVSEVSAAPVIDPEKVAALRAEAAGQESEQIMVWPDEIAEPIKKKVFGQDDVILEIANKIVINRMRKDQKLLVMALIGPTATGKSETAKALANVLTDTCKTPYGFIEIAGSEFVGEHSVNRFFGAPPGYIGYGNETVLEPVRQNPRHVIVINEIEKADPKLLTGLMEAIDTGLLGMADNSKPIDLRQCIMLFTSNIPVDMDKYRSLSKFERVELCRDAFTELCGRPEISGKIGNFIVFNSLSDRALMDIVIKFVKEELGNYDLHLARMDENLMVDFLNYNTKYGARGIRELVSDSIGAQLLTGRKMKALKGKSVALSGTIRDISFTVV